MTPDRLRVLALELPDVAEEAQDYGSYYRVHGHLIAKVAASHRVVDFFLSKNTARARKQADPGTNRYFWPRLRSYFSKAAVVGLRVTMQSLTDDDARALLKDAWEHVPTTRLSPPDYGGGA